MNVHCLTAAPDPSLAAALARFEEQFTYPLGPGRSFRISHGDDYPRFFRAIGDAACFVAERDSGVLGVLCLAIARVRTTDGTEREAVYLGDLKVSPSARGGRVLMRLAEAASQWRGSRADCGFAVVMDGTPVTPDRYTGRLGIPQFCEAAKIAVLRIPALPEAPTPHPPDPKRSGDLPLKGGGEKLWEANEATGAACFARLSVGRISTSGGNPLERSETAPQWLVSPDGSACGRFEDTRRAKRLIANDGSEMLAGHLSCIGYANHGALAELLHAARVVTSARGLPALFAAVPAEETTAVLRAFNVAGTIVAPATVFAAGFESGQLWSINTSEI